MVRYRAASAMAPIPFDKHGVPGTVELVDDFVTAATVTDFTQTGAIVHSELTWWGDEIGGNDCTANCLVLPGESDHPGILQLQSGTSTPADGDGVSLALGSTASAVQDAFVLDTNGVYMAAVLRAPSLTINEIEFGMAGQAVVVPNGSPLDLIAWNFVPEAAESDNTSAWWVFQVNGAGTDKEVQATEIIYVASDWVLLEIEANAASATGRITTEDGTQTVTLDSSDSVTMPIVALRPHFSSVVSTGTAEVFVDIDLFVLRYIRRQQLVGSWLGQ